MRQDKIARREFIREQLNKSRKGNERYLALQRAAVEAHLSVTELLLTVIPQAYPVKQR